MLASSRSSSSSTTSGGGTSGDDDDDSCGNNSGDDDRGSCRSGDGIDDDDDDSSSDADDDRRPVHQTCTGGTVETSEQSYNRLHRLHRVRRQKKGNRPTDRRLPREHRVSVRWRVYYRRRRDGGDRFLGNLRRRSNRIRAPIVQRTLDVYTRGGRDIFSKYLFE